MRGCLIRVLNASAADAQGVSLQIEGPTDWWPTIPRIGDEIKRDNAFFEVKRIVSAENESEITELHVEFIGKY